MSVVTLCPALLLGWSLSGGKRGLLNTPPGTLVIVRHGQTVWDTSHTFTGWADPDLSETGARQAKAVAAALKESGYSFDVVHTSVLKRAVHTTWLLLKELDLIHLGVYKSWRLNERSYGELTGQTVEQVVDDFGADNVASWRRSLDVCPPRYGADHPYHPAKELKYKRWQDRMGKIRQVQPPESESLRDVMERCRTYWRSDIIGDLSEGRDVLLVGHGNSIRGVMQAIDGFDEELTPSLEIPPCIPLVYRFEKIPGTNQLVPVPQEGAIPPLTCEFIAEEMELQHAQERIRRVSLARYGMGYSYEAPQKGGSLPGLEGNAASVDASLSFDFGWAESTSELVPAAHDSSLPEYFSTATLPGLEANAADTWSASQTDNPVASPSLGDGRHLLPSASPPPSAQNVVIIRHGKTEHNKLGLFTGWEDAPLAKEGREEATAAGQMLARHGYSFDVVYTSWLSRAIETAWLVLAEIDCLWTPIHKSWRLNERMYGALTGLSKKKTRAQYGDRQFKLWRRSYDTKPPPVDSFSPHYPGNDQRYVLNVRDVRISFRESLVRSLAMGRLCIHRKLPRSESLKDCMDRTIPYWVSAIQPAAIQAGKSVLISSSENAIRGLFMHLLSIPPERIAEIEIPNGLPMIYDVETTQLRLLEGCPSDYNFGKGGAELLFGHAARGGAQSQAPVQDVKRTKAEARPSQ